MNLKIVLAALAIVLPAVAGAETFGVKGGVGNSNFTAVFDAPLGERISASTSDLNCTITYDEKGKTLSGTCKVPLASINVDNEETKTEHFQQWSTNKKMDVKACAYVANFKNLKAELQPMKAVKFGGKIDFKICGKSHAKGFSEILKGTAVLFPAGKYGKAKMLKVRASIDGFDRDAYQIGPGHTKGWLARVQSLANVVAKKGDIEITIFGKAQ